jgi:tetratricopeptide (TPR) repeat protein
MICPVCNSVVPIKRGRCERCGEDLTTYKSLIMLSNRYYNEGLEKAKVRDLSGAILVLKQSLEINKRNTNARNLLGLVYYEMGETVSALSEWVVSKHFQNEDNDADEYMNSLQSNPTKLDGLNQTIKKYNLALASAKQGNEDLAIIQLKKVVSLNPRFVKALQLLALLYMKGGEYDKALKYLMKANKVDISNTTTLRYIKEIDERSGNTRNTTNEVEQDQSRENKKPKVEKALFPGSSYKEDKPNIWLIINLFLGVIIGSLVVFFLIVPTINRAHDNKISQLEIDYYAKANEKEYTITALENDKIALQKEIDTLKETLKGQEVVEYDEAIFDSLFEAATVYSEELEKGNPNDIDYVKIAESLSKVNFEALEREGAIRLYEKIKEVSYIKASNKRYDEGHNLYSSKKYEEAKEVLTQAYTYDPTNVNTIYFLGRTYHQLRDNENALKYYNILIDDYPDSSRATEAKSKKAEIR